MSGLYNNVGYYNNYAHRKRLVAWSILFALRQNTCAHTDVNHFTVCIASALLTRISSEPEVHSAKLTNYECSSIFLFVLV